MDDWPHEEELDHFFIGTVRIYQLDMYGDIKAGSDYIEGTVRSRLRDGVLELFAVIIPSREHLEIPMDGSVGIFGGIAEKFSRKKDGETSDFRVVVLRSVSYKDVKKMVRGSAHLDLVYNPFSEYTFPVNYYSEKGYLRGISLSIPMSRFEVFLRFREAYTSYHGCCLKRE